jgi:hypothetical protein
MAEPFARFEWMGKQVLCYLRPGTQCDDLSSLAAEAATGCRECESLEQIETKMEALASRYDLTTERNTPEAVHEYVDRVVSFGFMPRIR